MSPGIQVYVKVSQYTCFLYSLVVKALARYDRGPGFEPRLRLDFSPPTQLQLITKASLLGFITVIITYQQPQPRSKYTIEQRKL